VTEGGHDLFVEVVVVVLIVAVAYLIDIQPINTMLLKSGQYLVSINKYEEKILKKLVTGLNDTSSVVRAIFVTAVFPVAYFMDYTQHIKPSGYQKKIRRDK